MRAFSRYCLAPLVLSAAVFSVAGPASIASASTAHHVSADICPAGTHWDNAIGACVG